MSAPMSLTAEEVVAESAEIIQGLIDGLRSQRDKDRWMVAVTTIWEQVCHVEKVLQDLPAGFIIPTIIVAADQYVQHPDIIPATGKWPHIPHIINTMDHDICNHPWFQLVKSEKKVDKGKGKAVEVLRENTVAGSSGTMAMERVPKERVVMPSPGMSHAEAAVAVKVKVASPENRSRPNIRDMLIPDPGYEWVEYEDCCEKASSRSQSQAPRKSAPRQQSPSTRSPVNPPKPWQPRSQRKTPAPLLQVKRQIFDGVLIDHPAWRRKTSGTASPSPTATSSGTNPPTTPVDSTHTWNEQDLEEEISRLRQKQTEMEQRVNATNDTLATVLQEVTSLRQIVEAMREKMFPTPPHLQCPASCSRSQPASLQASAPPQCPVENTCTDLVPIVQQMQTSAVALAPPASGNLMPDTQPNPPSPIELAATTMVEDIASSGHPSQQGLTEPATICPWQLTISTNTAAVQVASPANVNNTSVREPTGTSCDWNPPERTLIHSEHIFSTDGIASAN
ncbi:hypothetical protein SCLCIDRAFT_22548 [Scleroderma citrinum Foug A]|uniref:Uncharacterized protein n=1 Tax=Scleroderma citrinum Foug A TaxID=1036808 RepID=A0A0C3ECK0_9AGAM|nr:hypothetical protein SCLCIDRAFT_22548 [Scleroderma citrinum Foug A]